MEIWYMKCIYICTIELDEHLSVDSIYRNLTHKKLTSFPMTKIMATLVTRLYSYNITYVYTYTHNNELKDVQWSGDTDDV